MMNAKDDEIMISFHNILYRHCPEAYEYLKLKLASEGFQNLIYLHGHGNESQNITENNKVVIEVPELAEPTSNVEDEFVSRSRVELKCCIL